MKTAAAPEEEMTLHPCPVLFGLPIYCDDDGDEDLDDPSSLKRENGFRLFVFCHITNHCMFFVHVLL